MWTCGTLLLGLLAVTLFDSSGYAEVSISELFNQLTDNKNKPYRVCVLERKTRNNLLFNYVRDKCSILEKNNAPVRCVIAVDRLDCLRKISVRKADFAVFQPEELLVASNHRNLDIISILYEFQSSFSTFKKYSFSMTAVVRNDVNINSLQDLKGKRLCHPGTDPDSGDHSDIFSQFFEDRIVEQTCDSHRTVTENRLKSLADYFGDSCRAGPWALDPILNIALKKKYNSLCRKCEYRETCAVSDPYWKNPLLCLSDCAGDLAWARVSEIQSHFKPSSVGIYRECDNVSYLCPDGTFQNLSTPDPCVWIEKPNPVLAAHSSMAKDIQTFLDEVLINQSEGEQFRPILTSILEAPPRFVNIGLSTPANYLKQAKGFLSSTTATKCGQDREIKLCVTSIAEKNQCDWLSAAAATYGVEPPISCYEPKDNNCYLAVQTGHADVFLTNSDQLLPAIRDYQLTPLLYETVADRINCKYFSILVNTSSNINKLEDLRGKKACFTAVDGVGWTTLVMELKKASLLPNICPYEAALANFFDRICITGPVNSSITKKYKNIRYCNSELGDDYDKQSGIERETVDCILNGGGDVAFVAIDAVSRYTDITGFLSQRLIKNEVGTTFKWLCGKSGVQEKPCLLTKTTMGQVLVHQNISYIRREDIISTFKNLDSLFGGGNKKGNQIFSFDMMAEFETSSEILFQDLGDRLELTDIYLEKHKLENTSYENEVHNMVYCQSKSSVQFQQNNTILSLLLSLILLSNVIKLTF